MLELVLIGSLGVTFVFYAISNSIEKRKLKKLVIQRQLPGNNTSSLVKEIINLTQADPEGWIFKPKPTQPGFLASYQYGDGSIVVAISDDGRVNRIFRPAEISLSKEEKSLLEEAFKSMWAIIIGERVTKKLLG